LVFVGEKSPRLFSTSPDRRTDDPKPALARIGSILVTLLIEGVVDCGRARAYYELSTRELQRDLKKLREIGKEFGFSITTIRGGRAFLHWDRPRPSRLANGKADTTTTVARIVAALGAPIASELPEAADQAAETRNEFLSVRGPVAFDRELVNATYAALKSASARHARVEFEYKPNNGARSLRRVEPYHAIVRSGRTYLLGYDLDRRAWRKFALDAISGKIRLAGTFTPRRIPDEYLASRAVGWFSGSERVDVTIRVAAVAAGAIRSLAWAEDQKIEPLDDGGLELTLGFCDLGEAVRWTLSFGDAAVLIAPPQAVALARHTIDRLAGAYAAESGVHRRRTG
jgi:predicted DNA-binding transcriptional regulator YafY